MSLIDAASAVHGGPSLPQVRRLVTSLPGPRSRELLERKAAAVSAGVGHLAPIAVVAAGGGILPKTISNNSNNDG